MIQTAVSVRSLSNFTCKLCMMRRGTLLILGHGVRGQGHLWYSVYKPCGHDTVCSVSPITFKLTLSNLTCKLCMMRRGTLLIFGVMGSRVKVTFGTLCIKPCGHDTDCSFSPIVFFSRLHM